MGRYFFEIAYSGGAYHGWQSQPNSISVQTTVETKMSTILGSPVSITGSSRTDTGVHCVSQWFHVDWESRLDTIQVRQSLNATLPHDIVIRTIHRVSTNAHARYSAIQRGYQYVITRHKNPFWSGRAHLFTRNLDVNAMNEAAAQLIGTHNFQTFSKVKSNVNHFICNLTQAVWQEEGDFLLFNIQSNRFLRGMVRAVVGTLLDVGLRKMTLDGFCAIMESGDRSLAGANAPPQGLYLLGVRYPDHIFVED